MSNLTKIEAGSYKGEYKGVAFFVYRYTERTHTVQNANAGYCTYAKFEVWDARIDGERGQGFSAGSRKEALAQIIKRIDRIAK